MTEDSALCGKPPLLHTCDKSKGRAPHATRRDDSFASLASSIDIEFGPVYSGEWVGAWRSRMPFARLFFVLSSGPAVGKLGDANSSVKLLPDTWAFLPPEREIEHEQTPGFSVVSIHFHVTLRGRPNPFVGRPMRSGRAPELRPAFLDLANRFRGERPAELLPATFAARSATWAVLSRVADEERDALADAVSRGEEFARLFEAVDEDPARDFGVDEMARISHMGRSCFAKRFHNAMGVSPRQWFNERRAREAAEALLAPGASVAGVAEHFGFGNEFYFSRFFKRHFGVSPSVWRNQRKV